MMNDKSTIYLTSLVGFGAVVLTFNNYFPSYNFNWIYDYFNGNVYCIDYFNS